MYPAYFKQGFDTFDRLEFTREIVQPLYVLLLDMQRELNIETYSESESLPLAYNEQYPYLFDEAFLNVYYFTGLTQTQDSEALKELGKTLFFDPILSANNQRSCASCHNPDKGFSDGLSKSLAFDKEGTVDRNSPGLINAVFAQRFFHDLRATPLEMQFEHVVFSKKEFNTDYADILKKINQSEEYKTMFSKAYSSNREVSKNQLTTALASYVASLQSFNSPVDRYLRGEDISLNDDIKKGYNLFMGKANCGTCHFAPTFAGLVPPFYDESESEILGVAENSTNQTMDKDQGRAGAVLKENTEIYEFSFKTPTVRNIALTAPYMHNGAYETLDQVIDFYNNGGGIGHGFDVPFQTLPSDSLNLNEAEKQQLIAFMHALTDTTNLTSKPHHLPDLQNDELNQRTIKGVY